MWFAGLDWADQHHDIVVIDESGRQVGSRRVAHSPEGFAQLAYQCDSDGKVLRTI